MGRDIKFKGWDSVNEVMLPVESINFREGYVSLNEGDNSLTDTLEMIELIQYTGLKDKNGKEVYEGDIIESPLWEAEPYEIVFKDYAFKARDIRKKIMYGSDLFFDIDDLLSGCVGETFEVIGNIYENPELLRGK
ncbi:YopX family protein [Clostridium perfringens]|nr:YopX family protein [Clostridium perfringens]